MVTWRRGAWHAYEMRTAQQHNSQHVGQAEIRETDKPARFTPTDLESDLHDQILGECKRRGWIALHGRMDQATGRTVGEPDFVILGHAGQLFLIECKSRTGKISPKQAALHAQARHLGHTVFTIRSFSEFLQIIQ